MSFLIYCWVVLSSNYFLIGHCLIVFQIQVAGLVAENQKLVERARGSTDSHLRSVRSLELKVSSLQGELDLTKNELETLQTEYDGYKVRHDQQGLHPSLR